MAVRTARRQFLWLLAGAGGAAGLGGASMVLPRWGAAAGSTSPRRGTERTRRDVESSLQRVTRTARALGTTVSITALHPDRHLAGAAIDAALAELGRIEALMSIYRADSQLSELNRRGTLEHPHPYLVHVLARARAASQRTGGAFDVTVQPLWDLYAEAHRRGKLPDERSIRAAVARVDWRRVAISPRRIRLLALHMAVTLNGIAQGFAADRMAAVLRAAGIHHALVNAGEVEAVGTKRDGEAWNVGIQHPRRPGRLLSLAKLADRCLATSGDYATTFTPDYANHHIFDPRTGHCPTALSSVSVAAASATEADALATAALVLGPRRALALIRSTPRADALLVLKDGTILATSGFPLAI